MTANMYGLDTDYFKKELVKLSQCENHTPEEMARALDTLSRVANSHGKVINLTHESDSSLHYAPQEALADAMMDLRDGGRSHGCRKALVLVLDDKGDDYEISFTQAGMSMSECISLVECAKSKFKAIMGY